MTEVERIIASVSESEREMFIDIGGRPARVAPVDPEWRAPNRLKFAPAKPPPVFDSEKAMKARMEYLAYRRDRYSQNREAHAAYQREWYRKMTERSA